MTRERWQLSASVALAALVIATTSDARGQQSPSAPVGVELPAVVIDAPAQAKRPTTARQSQARQAKALPKGSSAPTPVVLQPPVETGSSPERDIVTLPSASAAAAAAKLDVRNYTGSALNLTPRETAATVNIVSQKDIEERGARGFVEALRTVPGIVVGNNPGEPGTSVTRGFYKATGYSIDGARVADPVFLGRDYSSFHFDRIEVLKGPASVVSGTSGLAGSTNIVTKKATTEETFTEGMISFGSFNTLETGLGLNIAISPYAAARSTFTFSNSSGYVEDTDYNKLGFTNNILLKPTDRLKLSASIDYFKDDFSTAYYAAPLIQRNVAREPTDVVSSSNGLVLDKSIRFKNYNFLDGNMNSESVWLRGSAEYLLSAQWTLKNEISYYKADRLWRDADFYTFSATPAPSITRGVSLISHDHEFWSDRVTVGFDGDVGGMRNRFVAGAEYMATTFGSQRHFGNTPGVDIFLPDRGYYPDDTTAPFYSRTREAADHVTKAVFAEHAINLTPAWLLAAGIRYETIDLDRTSFNEATGVTTQFGNDLDSTTWRVGTTYEIAKGTSLFAQYAKAAIPISSALMIASPANASFKLSTGDTAEVGVKSTMFGGRVTSTASLYQIEQDDILTRDPAAPTVVIQGGSQRSRGIELETAISLTRQWSLALSGTVIDTEFTELRDGAGNSLAGNRPVNAVPWAWSALMTYRLDALPATLGAQLTGIGPFYTSNANLYEAQERTLLDAWVAFDLGKGTLRLRGRNLTDEFYVEWADYNATSVYVGAPRSFDVTYSIKW